MSIRVPVETVKATVKKAFLNLGLTEAQAELIFFLWDFSPIPSFQ